MDGKSNFEFWTPENQEGKKRYGREFLLNLKEKKLSKVFPEVLKGLDILQDINKPVGGGPGSSNSYGNYTNSSYGGQSGGDQSQGQYNKGSMSKKQMGGKYPSKPQNGNMVNRISQVRQITTKNLDMVTLGPGGGGGGFAWNKPKPAAQPTSDTNATSSSSSAASNSIPSSMSFTSGRISEDYNSDRRSSTSSGKGGRHHMGDQQQSSNTVTSRLSMDQNKANAYKQDRQFQNVKRMDSASNLNKSSYTSSDNNQAEFLEKNNLRWIVRSRESNKSASISAESYENRLNDILAKTTDENEEIFDKIENEFAQVDCESKLFIRALVISVCSTCLSDNKVDADLFKKRSPILNKFIAKKEELELEALFSVQALDHRMKHQPGIIRVLFDLLYDEDIIREDVFWAWKSNEREEGHVISVLALKTFFEWLSETESEQ